MLLRLRCYTEIRTFYKGLHLKKDAHLALVNMALKSSPASETDWKLFSKYFSWTICSNGHGTTIIMCCALVITSDNAQIDDIGKYMHGYIALTEHCFYHNVLCYKDYVSNI